jgi:ATP-dependent DNA helicase RecQ
MDIATTMGRVARGIIFALSRRDVDRIAVALTELGMTAYRYHSDLTSRERLEQAQNWRNFGGIMVATSGFGAGIDVPDVRYVRIICICIRKYERLFS